MPNQMENNRNLDDWQAVLKRAVDVKVKVAWQAPLLAQKSNRCCLHDYELLKHKKSKEQKDFKAKNNHSLVANNTSENGDQSGQALGQYHKKYSCWNKGGQQSSSSNTLAIGSNVIVVKKDKKQGNRNLSHVKCYTYHKKDYYISKCLDRKPKNQCWFRQPLRR